MTLIGNGISLDPRFSHWVPPCLCFFKINCDGAFSPSISMGAVAFVVRDEFGELIDKDAFVFSCIHPEFAEFQSLKSAILYAYSSIHRSFIVELHCQRLVDIVFLRASNSN